MNATEVLAYIIIGFALGVVAAWAVAMYIMKKPQVTRTGGKLLSLALVAVALAVVAFGTAAPTLAQTATPEPLQIPTGVIFSETNNWLETFAPIAAIGIGITVALAVLGYLGKMIASAFKG